MTDDGTHVDEQEYEARLWPLLASELLFLGFGFVVVLASLLGWTTYLTGYPVRFRLAVLAFLTVELLIPAAVYFDLRGRPDDPDTAWLHVAVMPAINVVGVAAYLEERRRTLGD